MTHRLLVISGAIAGLLTAAGASLRPSLTPRSTLHQGLVTGAMGVTGAAVGAGAAEVVRAVAPSAGKASDTAAITAAVGSAVVALATGRRHLHAQQQSHAEWGPQQGSPALGALAGSAAAVGVATAATGGALAVRAVGGAAAQRLPGSRSLWTATTATGAVAGLGLVARTVLGRTLTGIAASGQALDEGLRDQAADPNVSGGPGSAVAWDQLSREGARFVSWRVSAADITALTEVPAQEPVRVFVPVVAAPGIAERVDLAIAELDRLDAWAKSTILALSPAGTGYANSVPLEALEFLTDGDCAGVCVQYGVLPSMFSLNKVDIAAQTFRLLLERMRQRIDERNPGAQLLIYGESLGAEAAQHALLLEPTAIDVERAHSDLIDGALFVGTPGGRSLRDDLLHNPGTIHVDRWQALPDPLPTDVQLWFLEHDADPVTRFNRTLLWAKPEWLRTTPRGRNVPDDMQWLPVTTFQQVLLDVAYATQAQSGVFRSVGHDYRADLAPLVAAGFAPDRMSRVPQIQRRLAEREVTRDQRLAAAEGGAPAPADPGGAV